jgi:hypothetical protein
MQVTDLNSSMEEHIPGEVTNVSKIAAAPRENL